MPLPPNRWSAIAESEFEHEREALSFLKERLPDADPWHVWSNFEFIDDQGLVNEVDALVLGPRGLFLVEIKSHPGRVVGDAHSWTWTDLDGRVRSFDNPYILCNRKTKRLRSLLQRQEAMRRARLRVPYVVPLVFLAHETVQVSLPETVGTNVFTRGQGGLPGIVQALTATAGPAAHRDTFIDLRVARAFERAMGEAGIRPSLRSRRVGDYETKELLDEGEGFQDFAAEHVSMRLPRRVRIYGVAAASGDEARLTLRRAAEREFRVMEGISHPGIVKVETFTDTDRGPAIVFGHDPRAQRLDFLLGRPDLMRLLDARQRLALVRQLAETLKYAHEKRLYHRALSPRSILASALDQDVPTLQIMNWQAAAREAGTTGGSRQQTLGTAHLEEVIDDPARIYMAPETSQGLATGPQADVFSLGAIAYHLFTGQPPAESGMELLGKLRGEGLRLSAVVDAVPQSLEQLVYRATHATVSLRLASMVEVLGLLDQAERELAPEEPGLADPSVAGKEDRLDGGFTVVKRLGKGSSADALLVRRDGDDEERVLKVALDARHNDRLQAEAETLEKLRHQNIVSIRGVFTVAGRTALLMDRAGDKTLADHVRENDLPSLDLARRYGEDLLSAVDYLEEHGIAHRDIKPDNIGIRGGGGGRSGRLHLVLFDFSLSRARPENIQAGTRPYLDPFLPLRRPPRWDAQAEHFAVAVTLYEMLTGCVPTWGDGLSDPAVIEGEAILQPELFDPHLRDGLEAFFRRALRRDAARRFDNAEEMLRAWRQVFDSAPQLDALATRRLTANTPVSALGYSVEAQDVLEKKMGIQTVRQLLAVPRRRFRYLSSVADRVRREIREIAKSIARERPDLVPGGTSLLGEEGGALATVDELADALLPRRMAGEDDTPEESALAKLLGLDDDGPPDPRHPWPRLGEVARAAGLGRRQVVEALAAGRERWRKQPAVTGVRADLARLMDAAGGLFTAREAARDLLALRGSVRDDAERERVALAVVRAAVEAESGAPDTRFQMIDTPAGPVIAAGPAGVAYAVALGQAADALADRDPPASPQRAAEDLAAVPRPEGLPPLTPLRRAALAVAMAERAALSGRQEIYRRGLPAADALRFAASAFVGPGRLEPKDIAERVAGRYPEAEPLPPRPALDTLLRSAGIDRIWRDTQDGEGPGYYPEQTSTRPATGTLPGRFWLGTHVPFDQTPAEAAAAAFDDGLKRLAVAGGFRALVVEWRQTAAAERRITGALGYQRLDVDALLLDAMQAVAAEKRVDWSRVLQADVEGEGRNWDNLKTLAGIAWKQVEDHLRTLAVPTLMVNPGLIARYGLMGRLDDVRDACGTPQGPHALALLVPMRMPGRPRIDRVAVPVMDGQWTMVPESG